MTEQPDNSLRGSLSPFQLHTAELSGCFGIWALEETGRRKGFERGPGITAKELSWPFRVPALTRQLWVRCYWAFVPDTSLKANMGFIRDVCLFVGFLLFHLFLKQTGPALSAPTVTPRLDTFLKIPKGKE